MYLAALLLSSSVVSLTCTFCNSIRHSAFFTIEVVLFYLPRATVPRTKQANSEDEQVRKLFSFGYGEHRSVSYYTMRAITKYVFFLLINLTITLCVPALFGVNTLSKLSTVFPWIIPILVVLIGFLIGYVVSRFIKKDYREKAFLSGQVISCILFVIFATSESYAGWKYRHFQGNVDSNRDVMKYEVSDNEAYIRTAFNKLETSFTNPNNFELYSFHVHKQDTIINTVEDTLYTIYFAYFINANRHQERLAKITVLQDKVDLRFANQLADTVTEYQQLKQAFRKENKKAIEDAERIMRQWQQKGDQSVIDSLTRTVK